MTGLAAADGATATAPARTATSTGRVPVPVSPEAGSARASTPPAATVTSAALVGTCEGRAWRAAGRAPAVRAAVVVARAPFRGAAWRPRAGVLATCSSVVSSCRLGAAGTSRRVGDQSPSLGALVLRGRP